MRLKGFIAVGMIAAIAACSGGGATGTIPAGRLTAAQTTGITIAGAAHSANEGDEHSNRCHTDGGDRGESSAVRGRLDHGDDRGGGDDRHGRESCCPGGATGDDGRAGTRDWNRHGDDGDQPSPCPSASGSPAPGPTATPTPSPTPAPTPPPQIIATPTVLTIDCSVSTTATFTVPANPPGLAAVSAAPGVATVTPSMSRTGVLDFLVTGVTSGMTTINLTDTAGGVGAVPVTTKNC